MKKFLSVLLIAAMVIVSAAGCNGGGNGAATTDTTEGEEDSPVGEDSGDTKATAAGEYVDGLGEVTPDGDYTIGFSLSGRDQFLSALEVAFVKECEAMGVKQRVVDANNNADTQLSQVQIFASQNVDGIVVNLVNTNNSADIIAAADGIPVVFVNRPPSGELEKGKATYVGSDEHNAGRFQGEFLAEFFNAKKKTDANIVLLQGQPGLLNTKLRTESAKKALADADINVTYVLDDTAEWLREKAQDKMQTFLGTDREFDAVICGNDEMALGCIEAMTSAGVDLKEIPVVGIDATPQGLAAMERGELAFTVFQNADGQGAGAVRALVKMANGEEVDSRVEIPFEPVTLQNYKQYQ